MELGNESVEFIPCTSSDEEQGDVSDGARGREEEEERPQRVADSTACDMGDSAGSGGDGVGALPADVPVLDVYVPSGGDVAGSRDCDMYREGVGDSAEFSPRHDVRTRLFPDGGNGSVLVEEAIPRIKSGYLERRLAWDVEEDMAEQNCFPGAASPQWGREGRDTSVELYRGAGGGGSGFDEEGDEEDGQSTEMCNKELDLSGRCLSAVPEKVTYVRMLTKLDLSNNQISVLPDELGLLTLLVELHLHQNQLYTEPTQSESLLRVSMSASASAAAVSYSSSYSRHSPARPNARRCSFGFLRRLSSLEVLDLSNNQLCSVPAEIVALRKLRILTLSNNYIEELPHGVERLVSLEHLNIECNSLMYLPAEVSKLRSLESFVAYDNRIHEVHSELRFPPALVTLDLSRNFLTSVHPVHFAHTRVLRSLHLSGNQIGYLDQELFEPPQGQARDWWFSNLESLHVSDNRIAHLPSSIGNLSKLTTLNVARNQLSQFPEEIEQLERLMNLYACGNRLTHLPVHFGRMYSLVYADLSQNRLVSLPASIGDLCYLRRLKLRHNCLVSLPPDLGRLPRLLDLDVYNNHSLESPPPEVVEEGVTSIMQYLKAIPTTADDGDMEEGWQILKASLESDMDESEGGAMGEENEDEDHDSPEAEGDAPEGEGKDAADEQSSSVIWNAASTAGWVLIGVTSALTTLAMGRRGVV